MNAENRLSGVDTLRTIAIWIMIVANSSPYALGAEPNAAFRMLCSMAAPLFVSLSGYALYISQKKHGRPNYSNGLYILVSAILVDVCSWGIWPLHTFDVLYLIGIAWLLNSFLYPKSMLVKWSVLVSIGLISILLHQTFSYRFENTDLSLKTIHDWHFNWIAWQRLLLDGWFPLFPWLMLSVLGLIFAQWSDQQTSFKPIRFYSSSLVFIALFIWHSIQTTTAPLREGYIELFYPLSPVFLVCVFALMLMSNGIIHWFKQQHWQWARFNMIGQHSLFVYMLHTLIISKLISPYAGELNPPAFGLLMLVFIGSMYAVVYAKSTLESKGLFKAWPKPLLKCLGLKA